MGGGFRRLASAAAKRFRGAPRRRFYVKKGLTRTGGFYGRYKGANKELKFFDTAISFTADATGEVPATGQLALIPQGDTESTRDGRKAFVKSIQARLVASYAPAAASTASTNVFIMLVLDTQCNGAAAAVTDVLTSANMAQAMHNLANSDRFVVLKKWKINLTAQAGVSGAYNNTTKQFEYYKKCDIPINYSGTTGAITEIRSNNLFFLAGTDGASDDLVTVGGNVRLRFYD